MDNPSFWRLKADILIQLNMIYSAAIYVCWRYPIQKENTVYNLLVPSVCLSCYKEHLFYNKDFVISYYFRVFSQLLIVCLSLYISWCFATNRFFPPFLWESTHKQTYRQRIAALKTIYSKIIIMDLLLHGSLTRFSCSLIKWKFKLAKITTTPSHPLTPFHSLLLDGPTD